MGGQRDVHSVAQVAVLLGLGQVAAQPLGEAVELGVLQLPQGRVTQRPAPEADLDLGLKITLLVLIDGLSAERVLYPDRVGPDRQQQMLDALLGSLRA